MRKVLAVFMAVMMMLSTFAGIMTVSAEGETTVTLAEIALGNITLSNATTGKGSTTATDYINGSFDFAGAMNSTWASASAELKAIYAQPSQTYSVVKASDLTAYPDIASGHSAKLLKHTQTANVFLFRLKNLVNTAKLPATGKIRISMDVYPTDVTAGTIESTEKTGVKAEKGTLASDYKVRIGESKGSNDTGTMSGTVVKADQWNTITRTFNLSSNNTMSAIRYDVATGCTTMSAYNTPFPATFFYDKIKIEYIGTEITDGGSAGGDNTGGDNTGDDNTGDDNTGDDVVGGETVKVWEEVLNIPFENKSAEPAEVINIWGVKAAGGNADGSYKYVNWADETSISKPNSTEDFGKSLVKCDTTDKDAPKGLSQGRINHFKNFTFEKGAKYRYSVWAYLAGTTNNGATDTAKMTIKIYAGDDNGAAANKTEILTMGQWKKLEIEYEVPDANVGKKSGFRFAFGDATSGNYPNVIYIDNARVEKEVEKVVAADKTKVKIGFENSSAAPATGINFWGKAPDTNHKTNLNAQQQFVKWADETAVSKPNTTEDFGTMLMKVDLRDTSKACCGVHVGRVNDIPSSELGFTVGKKYTFSAWVLAAKTATGTATIRMHPYGSNCISETAFSVTEVLKEGEWKKISGSFVATSAHVGKNAGFRFEMSSEDQKNYPTLLYMDNLTVVEGDVGEASITVESAGNGTVSGSGKYTEGEQVTLTATPDLGYEFEGWYKGTTLLSTANPFGYILTDDGTVITAKFRSSIPNIGSNWVTIDSVDFEDATASSNISASSNICSGTTANGLTYKFSALNAGIAELVVLSKALTEKEAGIGTSDNKVYKFEKTAGPDELAGMMRLQDFFSTENLSVGDILRVSMKIYPTDLRVAEGGSDKTAGFQFFYSISGGYASGTEKKEADSTATRYLKANEWNEMGFTTTVTQEMLDAAKKGSLRLSAAGSGAFAKTMYFDDVKVEVYQDRLAADRLNFVDNFESDRPVSDISKGSAVSPYVAKLFSRKDNNATYPRFNVFGSGTSGAKVELTTNAQDLSGVVAHSGTNAIKFSGRWSANGGVKVEDIFNGKFSKDDIGRKVTVSAWVYADKSAGAYKLTPDGDGFKENGSKDAAPKYTNEELAKLEKTKICISFGGPNDNFYKWRTGGYGIKEYDINWNEWTKISAEFVVTEDVLDNGNINDKLSNPLISSIRIDQQKANGTEDQAIIDTMYIDDIKVEEAKFEVSAAVGSHMVYQKGRPIRVWGTNVDIGEEVTVKFNGVTKTATTTEDEKWVVEFNKVDEYKRNLEIEISCPGEETVKYTDVSVGEVILASGQSNMEWNLKKVYEAEDIIADAETNENISILSFEKDQHNRGSYDVLSSPNGAYWSKKDTATAEICSGVGYITAYNIAKKYNIPVAVVDANLSGSNIIAWLSQETVASRKDDVYKDIYEEMINKSSTVSSGSIWKRVPGGMFNSLLAPLDNYEIGIMLWYQGCSNSGQPLMYNYYQYDLINSWRDHFGAEDTPFVICQLAPYEGNYMGLRQVQLDTAKRMDDVYLVVTADLGPTGSEDKDSKLYSEMTSGNEIHPVRKIPVADRISKTLYANYFGEDIVYSGPEYTKMEAKDNYAILHFKHIGSGLVKADPEKELTGFEVSASKDGETFVKATAEILADNTIKVYAEGVDKVVRARYCWVNWVVSEDALTSEGGKKLGNTLGGNLTNETGIPAGPFMATLPAPTIFAAETDTVATGLDIGISVRNGGYSEASSRLIIGLYDGDRLVGLKSEIIDFKTIDTKTLEFSFYKLYSDITENTTVKAFLWNDMGTMIPLQSVYPIERK